MMVKLKQTAPVVRITGDASPVYRLKFPSFVVLNTTLQVKQVTAASDTINSDDGLVAVINRVAPVTTALALPSVSDHPFDLIIADLSTSVVGHTITLTPAVGETIMNSATWQLFSTADSLASIRLTPALELDRWIIS